MSVLTVTMNIIKTILLLILGMIGDVDILLWWS